MTENNFNDISGFSLIEVIIAITLAGVLIAALASSLMQSTFTQQLLAGRVTALVIGQGKLAEIAMGSDSGGSGDFPKPYQNYKWRSSEESTDEGSKTITLTVEWRDRNAVAHQEILTGNYWVSK